MAIDDDMLKETGKNGGELLYAGKAQYIGEYAPNKSTNPLDLRTVIQAIESEIKLCEYNHKRKIDALNNALKIIKALNTSCLKCGGKRTIFKRECAEDEGQNIKCLECNGSGLDKSNKKWEKISDTYYD